jgi:hypothetical protein
MGLLRQQSVVRIDKEEGPTPICFESRKLVDWDLSAWHTLIYASPDRNQFDTFFDRHDSFRVFIKGSRPEQTCVGRDRGPDGKARK